MTTTLFTGGIVCRLPSAATAPWLLIDDDRVVAVGDSPDEPPADRRIDLDGGFLYPAFCDAHVHLPATGLYKQGMDLRGERSAAAILAAFERRAADTDAVLFGGNFEDPLDEPLTRVDLDRAVGERPALLARADMHSCIVSTALLRQLDIHALEGVDRDSHGPTGYLREQAAAQAWKWFDGNLPPQQARAAIREAVRHAYSKGVAEVHEMHVVEWRGWGALDVLLDAISDLALKVVPYIATDDVERLRVRGFERVGGDYFLDGSFGSRTAWLQMPYSSEVPAGTPPVGISYRDDEDVHAFFAAAQAAGMQVGVHAIGDAAIEQAIRTWERVAEDVGVESVRALGHRVEHFECSSDDHLARASRLGLRASVQPAFDRYWGGPEGLYASRIGWDRARTMNRFATMLAAGLIVGAGSDSTVTPLDPFLQIAALREHHLEEERTGRLEAVRLHTLGARALAHGPGLAGTCETGAPADLVLVGCDLGSASVAEVLAAEVLGTWVGGARVWPETEADRA